MHNTLRYSSSFPCARFGNGENTGDYVRHASNHIEHKVASN
ncbi:hypothetical protein D8I24_4444 [Cupriavidus necator H850]|nr:hypothetical protein D8I24_4444 [Cupriavidus necator H850]